MMAPFPPPQLYVTLAISATLMSIVAVFVRGAVLDKDKINAASGSRMAAMVLVTASALVAWAHVAVYNVYQLMLAVSSEEASAPADGLNRIVHLFVLVCVFLALISFVVEMFGRELKGLPGKVGGDVVGEV